MSEQESLLRLDDVKRRTGLSTSSVYAKMAAGTFPRPVKDGAASRWVESEISAYIAERIASRNMGRMMGQDRAA